MDSINRVRRASVIELHSDAESDEDDVQIIGTSPVPQSLQRGHQDDVQVIRQAPVRGPSSTFDQQRLRVQSGISARLIDSNDPEYNGPTPVIVLSDNPGLGDVEDDEIQITGENRLSPNEQRSFNIAASSTPPSSNAGFFMHLPMRSFFQRTGDEVRPHGIRTQINARDSSNQPDSRNFQRRGRGIGGGPVTRLRPRSRPHHSPRERPHQESSFSLQSMLARIQDQLMGGQGRPDRVDNNSNNRRHVHTHYHNRRESNADVEAISQVLNYLRPDMINHDLESHFSNHFPQQTTNGGFSFGNFRFFGGMMRQDDGGESEEIPRGIMDEIRRREQISEDMRINGRSRVADKMKVAAESKAEISGEMALMFTNALCTPDNDSLCILCGVELAEGIPEDYIPISDPEKMKSLVLVDKFPAPYQCCRKLTTIDRDLSMKIFFGKCGHVYCGRCVNNIVRNSKQGQRNNKNKRRKINYDKVSIASLDFDDPDICAPSKCVAGDCNRAFRGNYYFRELYR